MIKTMDVATLKQHLENDDVLLIDVREPDEYNEAHIAASILIPLGQISYDALPDRTGKKLVIHCRSGKRSLCACEALLAAEPELEVYNFEGGILDWIAQGYVVET